MYASRLIKPKESSQSLPPGWEQRLDLNSGRFYYINHSKKTTSWQNPCQNLGYQPQETHTCDSHGAGTVENSVTEIQNQYPELSPKKTQVVLKESNNDIPQAVNHLNELPDSLNVTSLAHLAENTKPDQATYPSAMIKEDDKATVQTMFEQEFPAFDKLVIQMVLESCHYNEINVRNMLTTMESANSKLETQAQEEPISAEETMYIKTVSSPKECASVETPIQNLDKTSKEEEINSENNRKWSSKHNKRESGRQETPSTSTQNDHWHILMHTNSAKGPDPSLCKGPSDGLLLKDYVPVNGPDPNNQKGPNPGLRKGPNLNRLEVGRT
ncbi:uncharacterized protein LOC143251961 isoform X2 [Tachypleus tridentatus]|uniref:uncharacterized protein LOC143251961 isoform X2 n=1 Tax=Tachypleus tridentatus TaxID=6853 RepID=UPI003FD3E86D